MKDKEEIINQIESYYDSWFGINNIYYVWAKKHNINENILFALYIIDSSQPYCTQKELCSKLFLPKQTVSQILSGFEKDGYIVRETNERDRRNKLIKLTEKGESFVKPLLEELKLAEVRAFSILSTEQRESIVQSLKLLQNVLSKNLIENIAKVKLR